VTVARLALAAVLVVILAPVARGQSGTPSRALALRLGAALDEDPLTGRVILRSGGHVVRLCAGMDRAMVDDRIEVLPGAPFTGPDDLLIPAASVALLEGLLRAPTRVFAAVPARRSAPGPSRPAPSAQIAGGGRVVLDAGHGGPFPGTQGNSGILEKTVTLDLTLRLERILEARGWTVSLTRDGDRALSANVRTDLDRRAQFTRKMHPDAFVSIHANAASDRSVRGFEVFVGNSGHATRHTNRSRALAQEIDRSLSALGIPDRGIKSAGFFVIKWADCPAVLVETEFLSNRQGEKILSDGGSRQKIAEAIADALGRWRSAPGVRP